MELACDLLVRVAALNQAGDFELARGETGAGLFRATFPCKRPDALEEQRRDTGRTGCLAPRYALDRPHEILERCLAGDVAGGARLGPRDHVVSRLANGERDDLRRRRDLEQRPDQCGGVGRFKIQQDNVWLDLAHELERRRDVASGPGDVDPVTPRQHLFKPSRYRQMSARTTTRTRPGRSSGSI